MVRRNFSDGWKTKEGEIVPYEDMEDRHLVNTLAMLHRMAPQQLSAARESAWATACTVTADLASYYAEAAADALDQMCPEEYVETHPAFDYLMDEIERRDLHKQLEERTGVSS